MNDAWIHRYRCDCGEGEILSLEGPDTLTPERLAAATCRECGGALAYEKPWTHIARNLHFEAVPA